MNGFSILMFIFGVSVFLTGLYMYRGHSLGIVTYRAAFRNLKKSDWIRIGKYTMLSSIIIFLLALIGLIFNFE